MSIQNNLIIVGEGKWLDVAYDAASLLGRWARVDVLALDRTGPYSFDIELKLDKIAEGAEYFLALDGDHFGTIRESVLAYMMNRGCVITSLVPDRFASLFKMKSNCLVHPSAVVSSCNSGWGYNVFIGPSVYIGHRVAIGRTVTISPYCEINEKTVLGKNVSLSNCVLTKSGVTLKPFSSVDCTFMAKTISSINRNSFYISDLFKREVKFTDNTDV